MPETVAATECHWRHSWVYAEDDTTEKRLYMVAEMRRENVNLFLRRPISRKRNEFNYNELQYEKLAA